MRDDVVIDVYTDLPPDKLNAVGMEVFRLWVDFALGRGSVNGRTLLHPTGRYASSIQFRREGVSKIAIFADASIAPEALVLEKGHGKIDLKNILTHGKPYKMHGQRTGLESPRRRMVHAGPEARPRTKAGGAKLYANARSVNSTGYAQIGKDSPPDSWIIPPMRAYAPAAYFAKMLQANYGRS
ncbi:MAG: hypothetical protein PHZ23_14775 [Acidiphilium sp.]|nr:hypothetical protein [Acidiphilium sp.]